MSTAQDTADAIILVLKKLLKWIFLGALAISAVFFIIFKVFSCTHHIQLCQVILKVSDS